MRIALFAVLAVVVGLAVASPALALNGSPGATDTSVSGTFTGSVSGNSSGGTFNGTVSNGSSNNQVSGTFTGPSGSQGSSGTLTASEPLSALLVGLGLLSARFLRRS